MAFSFFCPVCLRSSPTRRVARRALQVSRTLFPTLAQNTAVGTWILRDGLTVEASEGIARALRKAEAVHEVRWDDGGSLAMKYPA